MYPQGQNKDQGGYALRQDKRMYALLIAVGVLLVLFSTCFGAFAGGLLGYWAGHRAATHRATSQTSGWQRVPVEPETEIVPLPRQTAGALVTRVIQDSSAEEAGIEPGDWIVAIDDVRIDGEGVLERIVRSHQPGDKIEITLWRRGHEQTVSVRLGKNPEDSSLAYLGIYYRVLPLSTER